MDGRRILIVGFGSIGQALMPQLFASFFLKTSQINIIAADEDGREASNGWGTYHNLPLTPANCRNVLPNFVSRGDLLINVSVDVSSYDLVKWCQAHSVFYIDTCVEPWAGGYEGPDVAKTTNWYLRKQMLDLVGLYETTAVIAHGANPGLVSHFVKKGLQELALRTGIKPDTNYGLLASQLGIRHIHIAERDTQDDRYPLEPGEFANTWSVDGLLSEAKQRAELGWGSHETKIPEGAVQHESGLYLKESSVNVKVKSWVPSIGEQEAYLITHHEALSIADMLTLTDSNGNIAYRPTTFYAYHPAEKTCQSLENWKASGFKEPTKKRIINGPTGFDELGVLFVYEGGSFWYGSTLTALENHVLRRGKGNATSLQVVSTMASAIRWMLNNPHRGIVEAEDMDHEEILRGATPYLGVISAVETDWQPDGGLQFSNFLITNEE